MQKFNELCNNFHCDITRPGGIEVHVVCMLYEVVLFLAEELTRHVLISVWKLGHVSGIIRAGPC